MEYSQHLKRICVEQSDDWSSRLKPDSTRSSAQRCPEEKAAILPMKSEYGVTKP
jgi:hypothetical protein